MIPLLIIRLLKKAGWIELKQKATSHKQFKHPQKTGKITISNHKGDIPIGTLKSILKKAGIKFP